MKHSPSFIMLACLLFSGCSHVMEPTEKIATEKEASRAVTCAAGADCDEKWARALQWVQDNSPYKVIELSDTIIKTGGPSGLNDSLALTVSKQPIINRVLTPLPVIPETNPTLKKPRPVENVETNPAPVFSGDTDNIFLDMRCNDWFTCGRAKLEARARFVDFVMGPVVVPKPAFGIKTSAVSKDLAQKMNLPDTNGLIVVSVTPKSLAEKNGLQEGDIILKCDGTPVTIEKSLLDTLSKATPNHPAKLAIIRGMEELTLIVNG